MRLAAILGFFGVLLAALTVELNDVATSTAIVDIEGGLGIGHDQGTWLVSLYATGQAIGMTQATFWALTVSIRRWLFFAIGLCLVTSLSIPLTSNLALLYSFRLLQGLSAGFTIPLLLAVALLILPTTKRLYGFAAYGLTATFGPNVSAAIAAFWTDHAGWTFIFLEDIPLCTVSALLVWYGIPAQQPNYGRIARYDWLGTLVVVRWSGSELGVRDGQHPGFEPRGRADPGSSLKRSPSRHSPACLSRCSCPRRVMRVRPGSEATDRTGTPKLLKIEAASIAATPRSRALRMSLPDGSCCHRTRSG